MLSLLEDEPSPEYDLPSPEVRAIQKLLYESLMKETLTVEMLQKYEQHLDTDIKVLACERCDISEDFEGGVRRNDISESRLAAHLSLIEAGYCSCEDADAVSKTKVSGFRLIHKMVKTDKNLPFLAFLHEHNCNLNARTLNSGDAAVMIAIGHEQVKTVSFLVDSGVSLNETINGLYPVLFAMEVKNREIFETLLAAKDINLNCISVNGPLLFSCITQYPEGVHLMLKAGADPEITDRLGHTALGVCARLKRTEMVQVLVQYGADVNKGSRSPLFQSVQRDDLATARVLLEAGADPNYCDRGENKSLITHASYRGSNEMIEQLIKFGGDVNLVSNRMYSAFHVAAWNGHYETIKILRAAGSDLDKQTRDKNTPLALAAHGGHLQIMKLLLSLGCNVNNADRDGDTPLLYAVRNSMEGGVELLLENGADPDLCDNSNASPLWTAVYHEKKDIVKQLLFVNVKMEVYSRGMDRQRWTDQIYYFYDSAKSPLYVAVEKGFHDIAVLLITAGYEAYREKWLFERELLGNEEMAKLVNNLMEHIEIPLSLLSICRNYLRQFFGRDLHQRVEKLNIPKSLKTYLLLK